MNVRFTPRAEGDLEAIVEYLGERSSRGTRNVLRALYATINLIAAHPFVGEATSNPLARMKTLTGYPYKVFYKIGHAAIEVVHIRHGSREPWKSK